MYIYIYIYIQYTYTYIYIYICIYIYIYIERERGKERERARERERDALHMFIAVVISMYTWCKTYHHDHTLHTNQQYHIKSQSARGRGHVLSIMCDIISMCRMLNCSE